MSCLGVGMRTSPQFSEIDIAELELSTTSVGQLTSALGA